MIQHSIKFGMFIQFRRFLILIFKSRKKRKIEISDDKNSNITAKKMKENVSDNYGKNIMSITLSNVKYKNNGDFQVDNITKIHYESEDEKPPHHSGAGKLKDLQQTLNLMNAFIMLLVMSYMKSGFKLLRISWYISMEQYFTSLKLVINKYLFIQHEYFPGFYFYQNDVI